MRFAETALKGAFVVELEPRGDERGFFARAFCAREFEAQGLPSQFPQCNLSRNKLRGTLRGMHYEALPSQEHKLVRCVRGAIQDVIVDLRPDSATRYQWFSVELDAESGRALFVPAGFGHGFLTLSSDCDVYYQMGDYYRPDAGRGFRYDDPRFSIRWQAAPLVISERDASHPDFDPSQVVS